MERYLFAFLVPVRDRQPSYASYKPEDLMISGLNMTEAVPLSSKIMVLLATPIMFAAIPTQPLR